MAWSINKKDGKPRTPIRNRFIKPPKSNPRRSRQKALELGRKVGISKPEQRIDEYPFNIAVGALKAMIAWGWRVSQTPDCE